MCPLYFMFRIKKVHRKARVPLESCLWGVPNGWPPATECSSPASKSWPLRWAPELEDCSTSCLPSPLRLLILCFSSLNAILSLHVWFGCYFWFGWPSDPFRPPYSETHGQSRITWASIWGSRESGFIRRKLRCKMTLRWHLWISLGQPDNVSHAFQLQVSS